MPKEDRGNRPVLDRGEADQPSPTGDGVDLSLIRWMLSLTPKQRLAALQQNIRAIRRLRDARNPV